MMKFSVKELPSLKGKGFVITGANSGLGLESAKQLAKKGANIFFCVRNLEAASTKKSFSEVEKIVKENESKIYQIKLDLADLASVKAAAEEIISKEDEFHCILNNAGIMMTSEGKTKDGFESQFGTNHLGHFAFTAHLFPKFLESATAHPDDMYTIVNLSSSLHNAAPKEGILFDDLLWEKEEHKYTPTTAYGHSKYANIVFSKELSDKLNAKGINNIYVNAPHPGFVDTNLTRHAEKRLLGGKFIAKIYKMFAAIDVHKGALTQLYCAASPEIKEKNFRGQFFVPIAKPSELSPKVPPISKEMQTKLWEVSEKETGVSFVV